MDLAFSFPPSRSLRVHPKSIAERTQQPFFRPSIVLARRALPQPPCPALRNITAGDGCELVLGDPRRCVARGNHRRASHPSIDRRPRLIPAISHLVSFASLAILEQGGIRYTPCAAQAENVRETPSVPGRLPNHFSLALEVAVRTKMHRRSVLQPKPFRRTDGMQWAAESVSNPALSPGED